MNKNYTVIIVVVIVIIYLIYSYLQHHIYRKFKKISMKNYDIKEIPNFLSNEECDLIIELSKSNLTPSKLYNQGADIYDINSRSSDQAWIYDRDNVTIDKISKRISDYTKTHGKHQEALQVVKYNKGGFFKPHYDACEGSYEYCKEMIGNYGNRLCTLLIYLNDDYEGGATVFPNINKSVKPEKGKAILFYNADKNGDVIHESLHGGEPVKNGVKWIANKWIRLN